LSFRSSCFRARPEKFPDSLFQVGEAGCLGLRARMKHNVPPRTQFRPMPANRFAQTPLEPVPFDRAAQSARNRQSHAARLLPARPGECHHQAEVAPAALCVHLSEFGGAQPRTKALAPGPTRRDALRRRRPLLVSWSNHIVNRRGRLLGRDGQALATLPAPPRQDFAPARRAHPLSEPMGLRPLPFIWLIRPLRHAARASSKNCWQKPVAKSLWPNASEQKAFCPQTRTRMIRLPRKACQGADCMIAEPFA